MEDELLILVANTLKVWDFKDSLTLLGCLVVKVTFRFICLLLQCFWLSKIKQPNMLFDITASNQQDNIICCAFQNRYKPLFKNNDVLWYDNMMVWLG